MALTTDTGNVGHGLPRSPQSGVRQGDTGCVLIAGFKKVNYMEELAFVTGLIPYYSGYHILLNGPLAQLIGRPSNGLNNLLPYSDIHFQLISSSRHLYSNSLIFSWKPLLALANTPPARSYKFNQGNWFQGRRMRVPFLRRVSVVSNTVYILRSDDHSLLATIFLTSLYHRRFCKSRPLDTCTAPVLPQNFIIAVIIGV